MNSHIFDRNYIVSDTVCYKNIPNIETAVITSLRQCIDWISVLKIEYCNLSAHQIEILGSLLVENHSILEVSVNGNPNKAQNFYLLLHRTNILMLSLKLCSIDSDGVEKISNELYSPYESCLLHLNLSSNSIHNTGVKHITRFLRINRTLISLNLADNKIYNSGCLELVASLQRFALNFEETVLRRRIKFEIQKKFMSINDEPYFLKKESISRSTKRTSKGMHSHYHTSSRSSSRLSSQILNKDKTSSIKLDTSHPFLWSSYEENQDTYCHGNDTLINLNLSYNRITRVGLMSIIHMVHYQVNNYSCDKGISRISTEGNDLHNCEQMLNMIEELLTTKSLKSTISKDKSSHLNLRKRS